jgi:flagellar protein FlaG
MDIQQITNANQAAAWDANKAASATSAIAEKASSVPVQIANPVQQTSPAQVSQALQSINKALETMAQNLEFSVDEDSRRTIVKVIDQQTKEVIRQMPTAEAVEISKALDKLQGLLIRQKA